MRVFVSEFLAFYKTEDKPADAAAAAVAAAAAAGGASGGGGVQPPPDPVVQLPGQQSGQQPGQPLGAQPALPLQGQHRGPQVIQQDLFSPFSLSQTLSLSGVQPCGGGGGEGSVVQFNSHQPGLHPSQPQLGQPQWPGLPLPGLLPPLQIF